MQALLDLALIYLTLPSSYHLDFDFDFDQLQGKGLTTNLHPSSGQNFICIVAPKYTNHRL